MMETHNDDINSDQQDFNEELPTEVRSDSLTEVLSILYVTIILLGLFYKILFG